MFPGRSPTIIKKYVMEALLQQSQRNGTCGTLQPLVWPRSYKQFNYCILIKLATPATKMESKKLKRDRMRYVSKKHKRFIELSKFGVAKCQRLASTTAESSPESVSQVESTVASSVSTSGTVASSVSTSGTVSSPPMEVGVMNLSPVEAVGESQGWEGASIGEHEASPEIEEGASSEGSEPEPETEESTISEGSEPTCASSWVEALDSESELSSVCRSDPEYLGMDTPTKKKLKLTMIDSLPDLGGHCLFTHARCNP